jgi:orotidine-5'-phosphate decarboxylase
MSTSRLAARDFIALAADVSLERALDLYERVGAHVGVVKVGLSLFVEHGPRAVESFRQRGARVFLDLKLHDIPNTVELAAKAAGRLEVEFLTVHCAGGTAMLESALRGARDGAAQAGVVAPMVLGVTVLTSMDDAALTHTGVTSGIAPQVDRLGALAVGAGVRGLVCSVREAERLRAAFGPALFLCTPGVRPAGEAAGDQVRVETPEQAIRQGSSLLVVGRPIYGAENPTDAAAQIEREVEGALPRDT